MVKYSLIDDDPLNVVANAILVVMTRVRDWEVWSPSMAAHAAEAVVADETYEAILRESDVSK